MEGSTYEAAAVAIHCASLMHIIYEKSSPRHKSVEYHKGFAAVGGRHLRGKADKHTPKFKPKQNGKK